MNHELTAQDMQFVLSRIPEDVRQILKDGTKIIDGGARYPVFLAGGFIRATIARDERPNDIDLLGPSVSCFYNLSRNFALARRGRLHETDNAYTILSPPRIPVQFIHRWTYDNPERLLREFDFTIAKAVIWYDPENETYQSMCDPAFYPDLAAKRLTYTSPPRHEDAGGSILRMRKFLQKGYHIEVPSIAAILARLSSHINFDSVSHKEDPEHELAFLFNGLLREVDPATIIDGAEIYDEIANRVIRSEDFSSGE